MNANGNKTKSTDTDTSHYHDLRTLHVIHSLCVVRLDYQKKTTPLTLTSLTSIQDNPRHSQPLCREIGLSENTDTDTSHYHDLRTIHTIQSLCVVRVDYQKNLTLTPLTTMISGQSILFTAFVS